MQGTVLGPFTSPLISSHIDSHLIDEEIEAQKDEMACPRLPNWEMGESKLELRSPNCQFFVPH